MELIFIVGNVLRLAVRIFILLLWVRFIIEWVLVLARRFRPRGLALVIVELIFTLTDPPIKFVQKMLPPIRLGQVAIDLGWFITMIFCIILLNIIPGWL